MKIELILNNYKKKETMKKFKAKTIKLAKEQLILIGAEEFETTKRTNRYGEDTIKVIGMDKFFEKIGIVTISNKVECEDCEGTGEEYYSCCGDDVKGTDAEDYGICPTCNEHLDGEYSPCGSCDGEGYVNN